MSILSKTMNHTSLSLKKWGPQTTVSAAEWNFGWASNFVFHTLESWKKFLARRSSQKLPYRMSRLCLVQWLVLLTPLSKIPDNPNGFRVLTVFSLVKISCKPPFPLWIFSIIISLASSQQWKNSIDCLRTPYRSLNFSTFICRISPRVRVHAIRYR